MTETTPRWLFHNPDSGTEMSVDHPVRSGECPDAENIRPASKASLAEELKMAWEAWAEDRARIAELEAQLDNVRSQRDRECRMGDALRARVAELESTP